MSDVQSTPDTPTPDSLPRRGLIASAVGLLAAAFLGRAGHASAQEEPPKEPPTGTPILGSMRNETTDTTALSLRSSTRKAVFCAVQEGNMGMLGNSPVGHVIRTYPVSTGGMPLNLAAVAGEASEIGVFGNAPKGVGVWGASVENIGTWGISNTGVGVLGSTYPQDAGGNAPTGSPYPPAGVFGVGNSQVGVWGTTEGNIAVWGQAASGIGVSGQSPHIGAWFAKGMDFTDEFIKSLEPAALHTTALGRDVSGCFRAQAGVAVMAEARDPATGMPGVALMAMGRIQSDMVGANMFQRGMDASSVVPCGTVTPHSHVQVTLNGDIGASVQWVELLPGKGFIVHLDKRARSGGGFTYFVVEPMQHEHPAPA